MEEHLATWVNAIINVEPEGLREYLSVNSVTALLVIGLVLVMARLGTRRLELRPTNSWQIFWEFAYESFNGFCRNVIGPGSEKHAPFLGTLFIYIVCLNLLGIVPGFIAPTASLTMTFALSLTTIVYVQYAGFKEHGWRYLMHFVGEPWQLFIINIPIHIIGELAKPLSLAVRLFGNIFGEDTVILQLLMMSAAVFARYYIPVPLHFFMVLFHIFVSFVQALVFMMLAAAYISSAVECEDHEEHAHEAAGVESVEAA